MTDAEFEAEVADFEAHLAAHAAERVALTAALDAGARAFLHHARPGWRAVVTPSARPDCPPGWWQVTRLDASGPQGHNYGTRWAGVVDRLQEGGYTVRAWGGA